jgi:two-component system, chemotaxis family, chemotaxis protein CheY
MKTCLVVDDSSVIRKFASRLLAAMDFETIEAESGKKALQICSRELPDAILLDWNTPASGYEFLAKLRRMPGGERPTVVFCTTENGADHIARALHAGADEYIVKPLDREILVAKFQEAGLVELGTPA